MTRNTHEDEEFDLDPVDVLTLRGVRDGVVTEVVDEDEDDGVTEWLAEHEYIGESGRGRRLEVTPRGEAALEFYARGDEDVPDDRKVDKLDIEVARAELDNAAIELLSAMADGAITVVLNDEDHALPRDLLDAGFVKVSKKRKDPALALTKKGTRAVELFS